METTVRERVLKGSGYVLPWILGIAFTLGDFGYIGAGITIAICLWYGAWNWRAVIHWKWAMIVIAFFAAIALKDCALWLAGNCLFVSVAKSSSRIVSLFGISAILKAYEPEIVEKLFGRALGVFFVAIFCITVMINIRVIPEIINPNSFGMDCIWFALFVILSTVKDKKGIKGEILTGSLVLLGAAIFTFNALILKGSRTALLAYVLAIAFIYISRYRNARWISVLFLAAAIAGTFAVAISFSSRLDNVLTYRQELWNSYLLRASERLWTGWGYLDPGNAGVLLGDMMKDRVLFYDFKRFGLGPHNSFLTMLFENGLAFLILYIGLLFARAWKTKGENDFFDTVFATYIWFMTTDAMTTGGITFLGFFLGVSLLAGGRTTCPDRSMKRQSS